MQGLLSIWFLISITKHFNAVNIVRSSAKCFTRRDEMLLLRLSLYNIVDQKFCVKQSLLDVLCMFSLTHF